MDKLTASLYDLLYPAFQWDKDVHLCCNACVPSILSHCSWFSLPEIFCLQLPVCRSDNHLSRPSSSPPHMLALLPLNLEEKNRRKRNEHKNKHLFRFLSHLIVIGTDLLRQSLYLDYISVPYMQP